MTSRKPTQSERLALVEQEAQNIKSSVSKVDTKVDRVLDKLDNLDERYPTRREFATANWLFGVLLSVIGIVIAIIKLG